MWISVKHVEHGRSRLRIVVSHNVASIAAHRLVNGAPRQHRGKDASVVIEVVAVGILASHDEVIHITAVLGGTALLRNVVLSATQRAACKGAEVV